MKIWNDTELAELSNLYHLAQTALAGSKSPTLYERRKWAAREYNKLHPEVGVTAAYKALDRADAWRR